MRPPTLWQIQRKVKFMPNMPASRASWVSCAAAAHLEDTGGRYSPTIVNDEVGVFGITQTFRDYRISERLVLRLPATIPATVALHAPRADTTNWQPSEAVIEGQCDMGEDGDN